MSKSYAINVRGFLPDMVEMSLFPKPLKTIRQVGLESLFADVRSFEDKLSAAVEYLEEPELGHMKWTIELTFYCLIWVMREHKAEYRHFEPDTSRGS
jgi:hypothetical protein